MLMSFVPSAANKPFMPIVIMLHVVMLSVANKPLMLSVIWLNAIILYAECHYVERHNAECHYATRHYAECCCAHDSALRRDSTIEITR
jgi:hypothetical protein